MIDGVSVANFKAFGKAAAIDLRPITLVFGPNSSGKSSLLHSLVLLRQIVNGGEIDAQRATVRNDSIDLGGYRQFVHAGRESDPVVWTLRLPLGLPIASPSFGMLVDTPHSVEVRAAPAGDSPTSYGLIVSVSDGGETAFAFDVGHSERGFALGTTPSVTAFLERFRKHLATPGHETILSLAELRQVLSFLVNDLRSPSSRGLDWSGPGSRQWSQGWPRYLVMALSAHQSSPRLRAIVRTILDYVKTTERTLEHADVLCFLLTDHDVAHDDDDWLRFAEYAETQGVDLDGVEELQEEAHLIVVGDDDTYIHLVLELYDVIAGICREARSSLADVTYLGPLRSLPARSGFRANDPDQSHSNGIADWADLVHDTSSVEQVNQWLGPKRLNTGLEIRTQHLYTEDAVRKLLSTKESIEVSHSDPLASVPPDRTSVVLRDTRRDKNLGAQDVGVGLAQVLPVIIRALPDRARLNLIEQPELHLHPSLQADLADAFIAGIAVRDEEGKRRGTANRFLLETHSEHFILRLLRRIRETSEGRVEPGLELMPDDIAVYYAMQGDNGTSLVRIEVTEDGDFRTPWPKGFFPERLAELT